MFGPGPAPICGVSCSVLSCAVALMPPVGGAGEGTTVRTGPGTWISGRLTSLVCPRPGLGPRPLPLPHSRGARTSVSRCCRPQALLQQWLRPQKSVLPDRRFLQGLGSGKVRIRSLNLMPAFPFCPLGASRRKASPRPAQGLPWHRVSHGTGWPRSSCWLGGAPARPEPSPWGKAPGGPRDPSPSLLSDEWGCGESWPSGSSGGTARSGPTPCPGVPTGRAAGSSSARGDRDAGGCLRGLWLVPRQDYSPPCWGMGVEGGPLTGRGHPVRPEASGFPSHSAKRLPSWWAESSSDSVLAGRGTVQMGNRPWRLAEVLPSLV